MFDFGNANSKQKKAVSVSQGPVLITAGPGTGKTFTLVQRTVYLIEECGVKPENIFIATFTEKASKELITRITNELSSRNISVNINEMYIGTFHSLCLRILKENLEYTRLRKNYRLLDSFDQQYMVFRSIKRFLSISDAGLILPEYGTWKQAGVICRYVNNLSEELVSSKDLIRDPDRDTAAMGRIMQEYEKLLAEGNLIDFSSIQIEAYFLLKNNQEILEKLQSKISHIMVDEYQDTNYIQEQIIFLLAGKQKNICVVGDDDQGLYRFRGATIRNILEFPKKFAPGECCIIQLNENYRSDSGIIDFYNEWMSKTKNNSFQFFWDSYRFEKEITAHEKSSMHSPAVVKLSGKQSAENWHKNILNFIKTLKASGKLKDYNQIAFLFRSVKNRQAVSLAEYLEKNGISVYSPRSDLFFEREEIRLALGCLMLMFPFYIKKLHNGSSRYLSKEHIDYYSSCLLSAKTLLNQPENKDLLDWIKAKRKIHYNLNTSTDYAYSSLIYRLFAFKPFSDMLKTDIDAGMIDIRPSRNLAKLTKLIGKFEYLNRIDVLTAKEYKGVRQIDRYTENLFSLYLRLLKDGGISEYEDDSEYAPSGCVSFLTIHQSKGMEFPIVFTGSLNSFPGGNSDPLMSKIEERYFKRPAFEPQSETKYFDFWRLYYTAFSRAQNLLILTCIENSKSPSPCFKQTYEKLPSINSPNFRLEEFTFDTIKNVNIKPVFSFTSHISVYETCPLQYKFYKELEFMPVRTNAGFFGTLVHQTIEDIHKAVLRNEADTINKETVSQWFDSNYAALSSFEHTYLGEPQRKAALNQVLRYMHRQNHDWSHIRQTEVDVSLIKPDYILTGKIDLIRGEGDTVEIVDFKSEKKPDLETARNRLEEYKKQLHVYAHLVEQRTDQKVSRMHLYYTGEETGDPVITFPFSKTEIDHTLTLFDHTVDKIIKKEFPPCTNNPKVCRECDFRYFCRS